MKNHIRDFFSFRKGDRRAVVALGCIAVLCIGVFVVEDALRGREEVASATEGYDGAPLSGSVEAECGQVGNDVRTLEPFDPNTVDSVTLVQFGIKPWKVRTYMRFRAAGKVFRSAKDMGFAYGWTVKDVEMLAPYVRVADLGKERSRARGAYAASHNMDLATGSKYKFSTLTKIDANDADSATLCRIPGISGGISNAILRYRGRLGGFYTTRQLLEISIFSPELLEWFTVTDSVAVVKLPINRASFQTLNSHPYITYDQARNLLKYIRIYGNVRDEQSLLATGIFTAEDIEKLRPYIEY